MGGDAAARDKTRDPEPDKNAVPECQPGGGVLLLFDSHGQKERKFDPEKFPGAKFIRSSWMPGKPEARFRAGRGIHSVPSLRERSDDCHTQSKQQPAWKKYSV
jgi:hypothetical protein